MSPAISASQEKSQSRFQVLSLDGGGIRGVFAAAVLAAVEEDLGSSIVEHFDLISGTSTGGIIALGLGLGMRPAEILDFYVNHGPRIFSNPWGLASLRHWFIRKYSRRPLETALRGAFGDRLFGESRVRLVVPAFNLDADEVYNFRTPHVERLKRDFRVPAWKVALATSAAPTFFSVFDGIDSIRLADGGLWANNPSMVALVEAVRTLGVPLESVAMLSVGTLAPVSAKPKWLDWAGLVPWAPKASKLIMRATSVGVVNHVRYLLGEERFLRVDPAVPDRDLEMDRVSATSTLMARARHHSRGVMPAIEGMFFKHLSAPYTPLHKA